MTGLRFCAAPACGRRVSGLHDFCATHIAMLPVGQARLIRRMRIEHAHAESRETRQYFAEQADSYVRAAAGQLPGARA